MATGTFWLIAQAIAAPGAVPMAAPDIEVTARVQAREVVIRQEGPVVLRLEVEPGETDVEVTRNQPAGAQSYRNLTIDARVAGWFRQNNDGSLTLSIESSTGEQPQ